MVAEARRLNDCWSLPDRHPRQGSSAYLWRLFSTGEEADHLHAATLPELGEGPEPSVLLSLPRMPGFFERPLGRAS